MKEKRRRKRSRKRWRWKKNASVSQCLNALMHLSGSQTKFLRCQSPFESFVVSRESYNIWKKVLWQEENKKRGIHRVESSMHSARPTSFPPVSCLASRLTHFESPARCQTIHISCLNTDGLPVPKQCCKKACIGQRHAVLNFPYQRLYEIVHHLPAVI